MIKIRAPGRICLFGEHQDYLYYPTISMAISKYIFLKAKRIREKKFSINLTDINKEIDIKLGNKLIEYESERDYLRSGYNQFIRKGLKFKKGYRINIRGNIPINAGAASSSALVIAWLYFLNLISNNPLNNYELALEGYNTEVNEFGEAGGKMDFFSSVFGNILYLGSNRAEPAVKKYKFQLDGFILGDSLQKKDTVEDIKKIKSTTIEGFEILKEKMPEFNRYTTKIATIKKYIHSIDEKYREKIIGNLINRDITLRAKKLFDDYRIRINESKKVEINQFYKKLGVLINEHQTQLRKNIGITTGKIDKMVANCLNNGALGAKINGSGFGGTMFAFGLNKNKQIIDAIQQFGGIANSIKTASGVEVF